MKKNQNLAVDKKVSTVAAPKPGHTDMGKGDPKEQVRKKTNENLKARENTPERQAQKGGNTNKR